MNTSLRPKVVTVIEEEPVKYECVYRKQNLIIINAFNKLTQIEKDSTLLKLKSFRDKYPDLNFDRLKFTNKLSFKISDKNTISLDLDFITDYVPDCYFNSQEAADDFLKDIKNIGEHIFNILNEFKLDSFLRSINYDKIHLAILRINEWMHHIDNRIKMLHGYTSLDILKSYMGVGKFPRLFLKEELEQIINKSRPQGENK